MAVVHEHDDGNGGSSAAIVAIFLIALIVILAIVFYGFAVGHWFGAGVNITQVGPSTSAAPSIAASASTTASP
jgi:flagellar basal body-associated protein FliL